MTYRERNQEAFDSLAVEFGEKIASRAAGTRRIVDAFANVLTGRLGQLHVLEIGPGSGYASKLLTERGYQVTAIDVSPNMSALAQATAPKARVITDDFLKHDFGTGRYHAVLAVAFVHLFSADDCNAVISKMFDLVSNGGIVYLSTTCHSVSSEGFEAKVNFRRRVARYRRRFTRNEFETCLTRNRMRIVGCEDTLDGEEERKVWMNYMLEKQPT